MATGDSPTLQHLNMSSSDKGTCTMPAETCQAAMLSLKSKVLPAKGEETPVVTSAQTGCVTVRLIMGDKEVRQTLYSNGHLPKDKLRGGTMKVAEKRNSGPEIVRVPLPPAFINKMKSFTSAVTTATTSAGAQPTVADTMKCSFVMIPSCSATTETSTSKSSAIVPSMNFPVSTTQLTFSANAPILFSNLPTIVSETLTVPPGAAVVNKAPDISTAPLLDKKTEKSIGIKKKAESASGCLIPKTKSRNRYRQCQRLRMRPWLLMLLNSGEVPGLQWVNQEEKIFSIPWKHASGRTWKGQDADLFERYAIHTGKHTIGGQADHKRWKANFRCALNSLHDVEELQDRSMKTGEFAYKLYRFLEGNEKKSIKKGKLSDRRLSDSSGGDIGDMSEDQNVGDVGNVTKQEVDEDQKATDLCLPHPPEIKDHNYSFVKSGPRVSVNECVRVIDADAVRKQLNKDMKKTADEDEDVIEKGGADEEGELMGPEFEDSELSPLSDIRSSAVISSRNSVDDTIEAVVEGSRGFGERNFGMDRQIKSELIIDDKSAQFVSNVMEVDTSPEMTIQSETRARIASAQSLAALSGMSISNDLAEEESNLAASILLDLSRMKRRSLQPRQMSFGNERMEEETPSSQQGKGTLYSSNENNLSVAKEMTSSVACEEALNTVPLDLRVKTEPMDEAYGLYNSSTSGAVYRTRQENSDSDDDEETCLESTPPPAHGYIPRIQYPADDDSLPQPLDLSVKVHNLVLVDDQDRSPQTPVCRSLYSGGKKSQVNLSGEEQNDPSEPLDLQVRKAHRDRGTPASDPSKSQTGQGTPCDSEQSVLPLDLSIVKSEPMDESYEHCASSEATPLNYSIVGMEEVRAVGPVPDLIQAPSDDQVIGQEQSLKQDQTSEGFIDLSKKNKKTEMKVPVPTALFVNQNEKKPGSSAKVATPTSGETTSDVSIGEQAKVSSVASSSPMIKSLLQRKIPMKRSLAPTCVLCHMTFANHHQLSAHMVGEHADATDLNLAKRKLFQCTVCAKVFKEGSRLERHLKTHAGKGSSLCKGCNQVFEDKDKFSEHLLLCSPAAELRCEICSEAFSEHSAYTEHVKTHHSDALFLVKPYQCAICNSAFENCNLLQEHMDQHKSGQITVPCCRCHQPFTSWRVDSGGWSSICEACEAKWPRDKMNASLLRQSLSGMSVLLQAVERTVQGSENTCN